MVVINLMVVVIVEMDLVIKLEINLAGDATSVILIIADLATTVALSLVKNCPWKRLLSKMTRLTATGGGSKAQTNLFLIFSTKYANGQMETLVLIRLINRLKR